MMGNFLKLKEALLKDNAVILIEDENGNIEFKECSSDINKIENDAVILSWNSTPQIDSIIIKEGRIISPSLVKKKFSSD